MRHAENMATTMIKATNTKAPTVQPTITAMLELAAVALSPMVAGLTLPPPPPSPSVPVEPAGPASTVVSIVGLGVGVVSSMGTIKTVCD